MIKQIFRVVVGVLLSLVLVTWGSEMNAGQAASPERGKAAPFPAARPVGNPDWDKVVAAAKQEGKVTIYTSSGPGQTSALLNGFQRAYGIDLEFVSGRGGELREKLFRERRANIFLSDLFLMGASGTIADIKPAGILEPVEPQLVLPEVVDQKVWYGNNRIYMDKERTFVLAFCFFPYADMVVNNDLVKPGEIKSYTDLLNPKWKGKIIINDPSTTGPGQTWFAMVSLSSLGLDYMKAVAAQEPVIIRDLRQQTEWVARGKYAVLVGAHHGATAEFMKAGAPIRYVLTTVGGYAGSGTGSIALINKAPHPNAAKVFINWLLTREGQTVYSKAFLIQSARLDVPTDHLDSVNIRQPGAAYLNSGDEELELQKGIIAKKAASIFAPGLK